MIHTTFGGPGNGTTRREITNLDDINRGGRIWNFQKPTLFNPKFTKLRDMGSDTYRSIIFSLAPFLAKMDWTNVVLMGGAIINILVNQPVKDLDLFIHGLDEAQTISRAEELLKFLLKVEKDHVSQLNATLEESSRGRLCTLKNIDIKSTRIGQVITVQLSAVPYKIQIVLATGDIKEITQSVDFEVNATYFDGMKVWFTPQGADEIENMTVFAKSPFPPGSRFKKIFEKGFSFIVDHFSTETLDTSTLQHAKLLGLSDQTQLLVLPAFGLKISGVDKNRITISDVIPYSLTNVDTTGDSYGKVVTGDIDTKNILYDNVATIASWSGDESTNELVITSEGDGITDVLNFWPANISVRQVDLIYSRQMVDKMFSEGTTLDLEYMKKFLPKTDFFEFVASVRTNGTLFPGAEVMTTNLQKEVDRHASHICSILPRLNERFQGKKATVCTPTALREQTTFTSDPAVFYGQMLARQQS